MEFFFEPPPDDHQNRAMELARTGAKDEDIAADLQIPLKRLQKRYRRHLEQARAKGKHAILAHLYKTAASGSNTTATMFWVKSACAWRDTGVPAQAARLFKPVIEITHRSI